MKILRWILVLPGASTSSLLAQFLFAICWPTDWHWTDYLCQSWNSVLPTAIFVIVGAEIAPRFKRETALVITTLYCAVCGMTCFYSIHMRQWWPLFCIFLTWVTAIAVCVAYWRHRFKPITPQVTPTANHPFGLN